MGTIGIKENLMELNFIKKARNLTNIETATVIEKIKIHKSDPRYLILRNGDTQYYEIRTLSLLTPQINIGDKIRIIYDTETNKIFPVDMSRAVYYFYIGELVACIFMYLLFIIVLYLVILCVKALLI
jgi:hypothetical protein